MFTLDQIELAHNKVKSGADFPAYIKEIQIIWVRTFETWVADSHTTYFGDNDFELQSESKYKELKISDTSNPEQFKKYLTMHQRWETDYTTFCTHCAQTGVEKWVVNIKNMTCTYLDKQNNEILVENIPVNE